MLKFIPLLSFCLVSFAQSVGAHESAGRGPIVSEITADAPNLVVRPIPRKSFLCAAMLDSEHGAVIDAARIGSVLTEPRAHLNAAIEPTKPRTLLRRFLAWFDVADEFMTDDLKGHVADLRAHPHSAEDLSFMRRVVKRLQRIEQDYDVLSDKMFPVKTVLRGRDQIRDYLLSVKKEAHRLEDAHPRHIPDPVEPVLTEQQIEKARVGKYAGDLLNTLGGASGVVMSAVMAGVIVYNASLDHLWTAAAYGLGSSLGIGVTGAWFWDSLGKLKISFRTYEDKVARDEEVRMRRAHEANVARAGKQIDQIDLMLKLLDDPATYRNEIVYQGTAVDLPMRNRSTFGKASAITRQKIEFFERNPAPYDPILSRWVMIDQLFQFDEDGEPTLLTFLREQMGYGPTYTYDGWTNSTHPYGF